MLHFVAWISQAQLTDKAVTKKLLDPFTKAILLKLEKISVKFEPPFVWNHQHPDKLFVSLPVVSHAQANGLPGNGTWQYSNKIDWGCPSKPMNILTNILHKMDYSFPGAEGHCNKAQPEECLKNEGILETSNVFKYQMLFLGSSLLRMLLFRYLCLGMRCQKWV